MRRFTLALLGAAAVFVLLFAADARATHDTGAFELEGNAVSDLLDDWDRVCHEVTITNDTDGLIPNECASATDTIGATAVSWAAEPNHNATIFTGGGSKDPEDITAWAWKDGAGGLPDKDNLRHAFAARYSLPADVTGPTRCPSPTPTCDVIFFGSDRFDNSGDAHQAFWFLQDEVGLGTNKIGGGLGFTGEHRLGDLLVISEFSNGGTRSTITIYTWDPTAPGNLRLEETSGDPATNAARCGNLLLPPGDSFCGIVNEQGGTTSPWAFLDKSGNTTFAQGEFYEAGVNLSALGLADECFSTVVAETRSSTSTTATLKDFVVGSFAACEAQMETLASVNNADGTLGGPVSPGTSVTDLATVIGNNPSKDPTGNVTFYLCSNVAAGGDCSTGGTAIGATQQDPDGTQVPLVGNLAGTSTATSPAVNTAGAPLAAGRYCFRAEWPGDLNYTEPLSHSNSTTECFRVRATSAITTAQSWRPQDSATVTVNGATVAGSVAFTLYDSGDCTGTVLYSETDNSAPFATDNTTFTVTTAASDRLFSWRAQFTPTDTTNVVGSTAACEVSELTIDNDG